MNIDEEEKYNNIQNFDINNPTDESSQGSSKKKEEKEEVKTEKKKGCQFPTAYIILIIIEIIVQSSHMLSQEVNLTQLNIL